MIGGFLASAELLESLRALTNVFSERKRGV